MKVLFLIYSKSHASGGHFHSLDQVSRALQPFLKVSIITIGKESPVLSQNPSFAKHYDHRDGYLKANQFFSTYLHTFQPDIVHCFDTESFNLVLLLPAFRKSRIVLNKCGGPNPQRNKWQFADNLVLFSLENYRWFKNNPWYAASDLHLIPNRVAELQFVDVSKRKEKKETQKFNFVRIQRIGAYNKTILDLFALIEQLKQKHNIFLYVIGTIQSQQAFDRLQKEVESRNLPVAFITDSRASKASDFLYLADCVVGTGRSFMEASSLALPVLAPTANTAIPVLVDESNFETFFASNFSERTHVDSNVESNNLGKIERLITDKDFHNRMSHVSKSLFANYFGTELIHTKYSEAYQQALRKKPSYFKLVFKNLPYLLKNIAGKA